MKTPFELAGLSNVTVIGLGSDGGAFGVRVGAARLHVIASWEGGWDHVSVSGEGRLPTWTEMARVKDLFFYDDECAMQLHPKKVDYIDVNPNVLHIWRPHDAEIPMPPKVMV